MTTEELLAKAKELIRENLQNHIREYAYKGEDRTYWAVSRIGMVWWEADSHHQTFDEAFEKLVTSKLSVPPLSTKTELEITLQKLRVENETLKLKLLELKQEN